MHPRNARSLRAGAVACRYPQRSVRRGCLNYFYKEARRCIPVSPNPRLPHLPRQAATLTVTSLHEFQTCVDSSQSHRHPKIQSPAARSFGSRRRSTISRRYRSPFPQPEHSHGKAPAQDTCLVLHSDSFHFMIMLLLTFGTCVPRDLTRRNRCVASCVHTSG